MIECQHCGHKNSPGHIFCVNCRQKLDFQNMGQDSWEEPKPRFQPGRFLTVALQMILLGLAIALMLALWPSEFETKQVSEPDVRMVEKKLQLLGRGFGGVPQKFTEEEVNSYLGLMAARAEPSGEGRAPAKTQLKSVRVTFLPNEVRFSAMSDWGAVSIGSARLGPWNVSRELTLVFNRDSDAYKWKIKSGKIGHLPLPGASGALAVSAFRPLMKMGASHMKTISSANRVELESGQITINAGKRK